jgi:SAM-dependent methyltransferase
MLTCVSDPMEQNRILWEERAEIHPGTEFYDLPSFLSGQRPIRLSDYELAEIGDCSGKDLLHIQCHFGLDTLSWARLGARVTGTDFSSKAIATARDLAEQIGVEANFLVSNTYDLPNSLTGDFDIVYMSRGVLFWLPDLFELARIVESFLRPGGIFYVTEVHPVALVFDDEEGVTDLRLRWPYFERPEPLRFPVKGTYADPKADVETTHEFSWIHSLGEVVSAVAAAGLRIDFLHEFDFCGWPMSFLVPHGDVWRLPPDQQGELPLFFSLRATKP